MFGRSARVMRAEHYSRRALAAKKAILIHMLEFRFAFIPTVLQCAEREVGNKVQTCQDPDRGRSPRFKIVLAESESAFINAIP
jgi:hypothetical protein